MLKPRTHFEQVPLEIVKKIIEEKNPPETAFEPDPKTRRQRVEKDFSEIKKKSTANSGISSQMKLSE
jgi:hypothetical protein